MWKLVRGRALGLPRRRNRRGQSILEYVVIATVIVLALFAIQSNVQTNMNTIFNSASNKTKGAGTQLSDVNFAVQLAK